MVKLTSCNTSFEAELIKGRLANEDMPCVLTNENMSNLYGGIIANFTQVDVYVREEDIERAQAIIAEENQETDEEG